MSIDETALKNSYIAHNKTARTGLSIARFTEVVELYEAAKTEQPDDCSEEDLIDALMNEHDMDVPDNLLAAPDHPLFKSHRNGVKAMLSFLNKRAYKPPPKRGDNA